jgi:hypothetical protein
LLNKSIPYNRPVAKAIGRSAKGKPGAKRKALGADSVSFRNISNIVGQFEDISEIEKNLVNIP